jgi:hypothetical protein
MRRLTVLAMNGSKGQSAMEYGVTMLGAIMALAALTLFIQHSIEGYVRSGARDIDEVDSPIEQPYQPDGTSGQATHIYHDQTSTTVKLYGVDQDRNLTTVNPYQVEAVGVTEGSISENYSGHERMRP